MSAVLTCFLKMHGKPEQNSGKTPNLIIVTVNVTALILSVVESAVCDSTA